MSVTYGTSVPGTKHMSGLVDLYPHCLLYRYGKTGTEVVTNLAYSAHKWQIEDLSLHGIFVPPATVREAAITLF